MKKILEGSHAVAEAVKLVEPDVCGMYPITPSTHIPERISEFESDGEIRTKVIRVESEFSAISACLGAAAAGSRAFTATASQGVALMNEILYIFAGMRLPMVMAVGSRALSAPLSIWCDHQDTMEVRDAGWIQLFAESNQEALDNTIQAFKIAEDKRVLLPVMTCLDGFILTHVFEPVDVPEKKDVDAFLPKYTPEHAYLDPARPITQGAWSAPKYHMELKSELNKAMNDSINIIKEVHDDYAKRFGRKIGNGLVETYGKSDTVFVGMGSMCGSLKVMADKLGFEVLKIRCYRPFPKEDVRKALAGKKLVVVVDRNAQIGMNCGALFEDVRNALYDEPSKPKMVNFQVGLGGVDITTKTIEEMHKLAPAMKSGEARWLQ